ncbi:MAG: hypothetical protein PHW10_05425 [Candidatus Peribacteraceae bacterium]|nr:hypothetical protein [Candidatus Peribacteraceae bacterium]
MHTKHILIADDVDTAKIARIESVAGRDPRAVLHVARSAREALDIIGMFGERIDAAAIDFDYIGEPYCGADIIGALRRDNADAAIALVTAREGQAFDQASGQAMTAGANAAFTSADAFEGELNHLFMAA